MIRGGIENFSRTVTLIRDEENEDDRFARSEGQVECQHQTLNYLAKFISENQKDWDRWIPLYLLTYRSSKYEIIGMTPAEVYLLKISD